jgi:hypothetical protein
MHFTRFTRFTGPLLSLLVLQGAAGCGGSDGATTPVDDAEADAVAEAEVGCSSGQLACGGACVTVATDPLNCGGCGTKCGTSEACVDGKCTTTCPSGQSVCDNQCATLQTDAKNCGACGKGCAVGEVCSNGACATSCASNLITCGSGDAATAGDAGDDAAETGDAGGSGAYCANPQTDNANCGACGVACGAGESCQAGKCATTCGVGQTACTAGDAGATTCANLQTDNQNCGACGAACPDGQACQAGKCTTTCGGGQTLCGAGTAKVFCAALDTDNQNCGACGTVCGAGQACTAGKCAATCGAGQTRCTGTGGAADFCADLTNDPKNCGSCGGACAAGMLCKAGVCAPSCAPFATCPASGTDPAYCADFSTDARNCGGCGKACADGQTCFASTCVASTSLTVKTDTNLAKTNMNGRACADGGDMVAYSVTALGASSATLATSPATGCLAVGDEVLLINLQGTATASGNTGNYETLTVASVAGGTVTFASPKKRFYGDGASDDANLGTARTNQRVMLQRVPSYTDVYVANGATLSGNAWNGTLGGVFAIRATGNVIIAGTVSMRGAGYAGGGSTTVENATGLAGESVSGLGAVGEYNNGGAGGGGIGDGQGCDSFGVAGGGGGHATVGGHGGHFCGGAGGGTYGSPTLDRLLMGSGGGAGGTDNTLADNPPGAAGGAGGGILALWSSRGVVLNGTLDASGANGAGDAPGSNCGGSSSTTSCWDWSGPGGGGAGGSAMVRAASVSAPGNVIARGGLGGGGSNAGLGGDGGRGRTWPLPQTCADIATVDGDGEYLFALGGDATKPFRAYCKGVGTSGAKMYLTLANTAAGQNYSRYDATRLDGENGSTTIVTKFQRIAFDPTTMLVDPADYAFSSSTGEIKGGPFVGTTYPFGYAGDCACGGTHGSANVDLRGLPFAIDASNAWTLNGAGPSGSSSVTIAKQVVNVTGGGCCGDNHPTTNGGKIKLAYYASTAATCADVKSGVAGATDGVYGLAPDASVASLPVYCDMTNGGWMLLEDTTAALPPNALASGTPTPGSGRAFPMSTTRLLASLATQVHLRSTSDVSQSFTTTTGSQPIKNLRLGLLLDQSPTSWVLGDYAAGGGWANSYLPFVCDTNGKGWPNVYHACGNDHGLHLMFDASRWDYAAANGAMELFVK